MRLQLICGQQIEKIYQEEGRCRGLWRDYSGLDESSGFGIIERCQSVGVKQVKLRELGDGFDVVVRKRNLSCGLYVWKEYGEKIRFVGEEGERLRVLFGMCQRYIVFLIYLGENVKQVSGYIDLNFRGVV